MVNDYFSIGIGGRYWHIQTTEGHAHFENHVVTGTALPQELRWSTENYGVFLQGSILLGSYSSEVF